MEKNNYNKKMAELKKTATERIFADVIGKTISKLNALYPMAHAEQEDIMAKAVLKRNKVEEQWRKQKEVVEAARLRLTEEQHRLGDIELETKAAIRKIDEWQHDQMCKCLEKIAPDTAKLSESFVDAILQTMHEQKLLFEGDAMELAALRSEKYRRQQDEELKKEAKALRLKKVSTRKSNSKTLTNAKDE